MTLRTPGLAEHLTQRAARPPLHPLAHPLEHPPRANDPASLWRVAVLLFAVVCGSAHLASKPTLSNEESFVAATSREMLQRHARGEPYALLEPWFSGEVRVKKTPLPYWTCIASSWLFSTLHHGWNAPIQITELSTRAPAVLYLILISLVCFEFGRRAYSTTAGAIAGLLCSASVFGLKWGQNGSAELGLAFFCLLTLFLAWSAAGLGPSRKRLWMWIATAIAATLGMLQKAPMPLLFCGPPILLLLLAQLRPAAPVNLLRDWRLALAGLVFLLGSAAWPAWIAATHPGAADVFWHETVGRFTGDMTVAARQAQLAATPDAANTALSQPSTTTHPNASPPPPPATLPYSISEPNFALPARPSTQRTEQQIKQAKANIALYLKAILVYSFPWSFSILVAPLAVLFARQWRSSAPASLYLLAAAILPLTVLCLSAGREERYIVPLLPVLFLPLAAHYQDLFAQGRPRIRTLVGITCGLCFVLALVLFATACLAAGIDLHNDPPALIERSSHIAASIGISMTSLAEQLVSLTAELAPIYEPLRWPLACLFGLIAIATAAAAALYARSREQAAFCILILLPLTCAGLFRPALAPLLDSGHEERSFANWMNDHVPPNADIRWIGTQNATLIYYAQRPMQRLLTPESEALFERNRTYSTGEYRTLIDQAAKLIASDQLVFLAGEQEAFDRAVQILALRRGQPFPDYTVEARIGPENSRHTIVCISNRRQLELRKRTNTTHSPPPAGPTP